MTTSMPSVPAPAAQPVRKPRSKQSIKLSPLLIAIIRYSVAGAVVGAIGSHLRNAGRIDLIDPVSWGAFAGSLCWIRSLEISQMSPELAKSLDMAVAQLRANVDALISLGSDISSNQERQDLLGRELSNSIIPLVNAIKQLDVGAIQRALAAPSQVAVEQPTAPQQQYAGETYRPEPMTVKQPERVSRNDYRYDESLLED